MREIGNVSFFPSDFGTLQFQMILLNALVTPWSTSDTFQMIGVSGRYDKSSIVHFFITIMFNLLRIKISLAFLTCWW